ncbi:MAG: site-specific integrase [Sedimentisphaerales bacterium]|nr:site-specific integrase [Sedimentisphaerales bacterium]
MKVMVTLWQRPSANGKRFTYYLLYTDENGRRRQKSLGHGDRRRAEKQRAQLERELRMGVVEPESMRLSEFWQDWLKRTGDQIRESTQVEYATAMKHFIEAIGDIDYQQIGLRHAERFLQLRLDQKDSPATVGKKLRELRRIFQLATDRGQLESNPLARVKQPRVPKKSVRTYSQKECEQILRASRQCREKYALRWDLLIPLALTTAMRKSELLNLTWADIDFEAQTIEVRPKADTIETWRWEVKDSDCRTLPLTEELISLLTEHQANQKPGYPYVFVPAQRYDHIQQLRTNGKWSYSASRIKVVNNFTQHFKQILKKANVRHGKFHDLRCTALSNLLAQGLSQHDVMVIAGHAKFDTTQRFYLAVADDLVSRARQAAEKVVSKSLLQFCCSAIPEGSHEKSSQT